MRSMIPAPDEARERDDGAASALWAAIFETKIDVRSAMSEHGAPLGEQAGTLISFLSKAFELSF